MGEATGPLTGRRVLDLSQAIAGPYVGRILADLGADVVKVEWTNGDVTNRFGPPTAGLTGLFHHMNAGKRGIGLDLKSPAAGDLIRRLAARADIVIENFRPGVLARAGLGYAEPGGDQPGPRDGVGVGVRTERTGGRTGRVRAGHPRRVRTARPPGGHRRPPDRRHRDVARRPGHRACTRRSPSSPPSTSGRPPGVGQHVGVGMLEAMVATDDKASEAIDGVTDPADSRGYVWEATGGLDPGGGRCPHAVAAALDVGRPPRPRRARGAGRSQVRRAGRADGAG